MNSNRDRKSKSRAIILLSALLAIAIHAHAQAPGDYTAIGVYRAIPGGVSNWIVDSSGNHVYDSSDQIFSFGLQGDTPIMGDWKGIQHLQMGTFRCDSSTGYAYWELDWNDNHYWDQGDESFSWGVCGDTPVVGDWTHTGKLQIGVIRNVNGYLYWYVNTSPECGSSNPQGCDYFYTMNTYSSEYVQVFQLGSPNDIPAIGNWPSPSMLGAGIYRPSEGNWYLTTYANSCSAINVTACDDFWTNYNNGTYSIVNFDPYWPTGGTAVTGCWSGACPSVNMGIFSAGAWTTDTSGNQQNPATYSFGLSGDVPVTGPWVGPPGSLTITTTSPLQGEAGYYSKSLQARGGTRTGYTWSSADLPSNSWLTLGSDGTLSGYSSGGVTTFHATVTDSSGSSFTAPFTLYIGYFTAPATLTLSGSTGTAIPFSLPLTSVDGYYNLGGAQILISQVTCGSGTFAFNSSAISFNAAQANSTQNITGTFTPATSPAQCQIEANDGEIQTYTTVAVGAAAPVITSITPTSGPPGSTVAISGNNLMPSPSVTINGMTASVMSSPQPSSSGLTAMVPAAPIGMGAVQVTVNGMTATAQFQVTQAAAPSLYPAFGPPGTFVTITGAGLGASGTVTVGSTAAIAQTWVLGGAQIQFVVPPGMSMGAYSVVINPKDPSGAALPSITLTFTVTVSFTSRSTGPPQMGIILTATNGTNFGSALGAAVVQLQINGAPTQPPVLVESWSPASVVVEIPSGASQGQGTITLTANGQTASSPFTVTGGLIMCSTN